jgi:hypothetical protein
MLAAFCTHNQRRVIDAQLLKSKVRPLRYCLYCLLLLLASCATLQLRGWHNIAAAVAAAAAVPTLLQLLLLLTDWLAGVLLLRQVSLSLLQQLTKCLGPLLHLLLLLLLLLQLCRPAAFTGTTTDFIASAWLLL